MENSKVLAFRLAQKSKVGTIDKVGESISQEHDAKAKAMYLCTWTWSVYSRFQGDWSKWCRG